jgi:hypothetical protein
MQRGEFYADPSRHEATGVRAFLRADIAYDWRMKRVETNDGTHDGYVIRALYNRVTHMVLWYHA